MVHPTPTDTAPAAPPELDELAALHAAIRETPDDPAERARRSATAYLDARRARLRRELRG